MHGDSHKLWALGGLRIEAFKLIHDAPIHFVGGMVLQRHHHDVMKFKIVRQSDDGFVCSLKCHRFIIEYPIPDVLDTGCREIVERVEGLRQTRSEPTARLLASEFGNDRYGLVDHCLLIIELMHWYLIVAVRIKFPTSVDAGLGDNRVGFADPGVQRDRRTKLECIEHILDAPEADPHAVFVPAPVWMIWDHRLALRWSNDHTRHGPRHVPFLQRQYGPHDKPQSVWQL